VTRILLYGGKGGVGKTTCAAATALALADRGEHVLVVSTDPAHSLGDALGVSVGDEVTELFPRLSGVEVGPKRGQAAYRRVVEALADEFRSAGLGMDDEDMEALFGAGVLPGGDEAAALDILAEYADSERFDAVVLDTAPTGHTLRLLHLPDVLDASLTAAGRSAGWSTRPGASCSDPPPSSAGTRARTSRPSATGSSARANSSATPTGRSSARCWSRRRWP
jgi:arsenite-transporting ATPase